MSTARIGIRPLILTVACLLTWAAVAEANPPRRHAAPVVVYPQTRGLYYGSRITPNAYVYPQYNSGFSSYYPYGSPYYRSYSYGASPFYPTYPSYPYYGGFSGLGLYFRIR